MKKILLLLCTILLFACEDNYVTQKIKETAPLQYDGYVALYTKVFYKGELVKVWIDDVGTVTPPSIKQRKLQGDSLIKELKKLGL